MENGSRKIGLRIFAGFLVAVMIIVAVFASGITLPGFEKKTGRLTVLLIDAPVTLHQLNVTITELEVRPVGEGDDDGDDYLGRRRHDSRCPGGLGSGRLRSALAVRRLHAHDDQSDR